MVLQIMWDEFDSSASWNSAVVEVKKLQAINPFVDIMYSVSTPGGGGLVSSRWVKKNKVPFT